jgi:6-phosphogluconolactonase
MQGAGGAGGSAQGGAGGMRDAGATADAAVVRDASGDMAAPAGNPLVYISGGDPQIRWFLLDMNTGALAMKGMAAGGTNPSYLAIRPDRKFLYALNEGSPGKILAYSIDQATGALTKINEASSGGNGPAHLSVHKSGKWVLSSNYGSGHVATLEIMANGGVAEPLAANILQPVMQHAHQIVADVAGKYVFVPSPEPAPGSTMGRIAQLVIDVNTGKLTPNNPASAMSAADARPRHIAFHGNEKWAYDVNETGSTVVSWMYDAAGGKLSQPETQTTLPAGYAGAAMNTCAHVVVHPSGKFLYVSNRGHNSIVTYAINDTTGRLASPVWETGGGMIKTPRDFGVDPTGSYLIVASQSGNSLIVFRINKADGKLTMVGQPVTVPTPEFVGFL